MWLRILSDPCKGEYYKSKNKNTKKEEDEPERPSRTTIILSTDPRSFPDRVNPPTGPKVLTSWQTHLPKPLPGGIHFSSQNPLVGQPAPTIIACTGCYNNPNNGGGYMIQKNNFMVFISPFDLFYTKPYKKTKEKSKKKKENPITDKEGIASGINIATQISTSKILRKSWKHPFMGKKYNNTNLG